MMPLAVVEHQAASGKRTPLLTFPPLRTGRVPLKTSGSSTSRPTRLLAFLLPCSPMDELLFCEQALVVEVLTVAHGSCRLGMNVLMTEQMNQHEVAVGILSPLSLCQKMVNLKFFIVEERVSTLWASALLSLDQFLVGMRQVCGFGGLPFRPVVLQLWVIR